LKIKFPPVERKQLGFIFKGKDSRQSTLVLWNVPFYTDAVKYFWKCVMSLIAGHYWFLSDLINIYCDVFKQCTIQGGTLIYIWYVYLTCIASLDKLWWRLMWCVVFFFLFRGWIIAALEDRTAGAQSIRLC
jgi:hypothetical protein